MSCSCAKPTPQPLRVNREALRAVLGTRELVEAEEAIAAQEIGQGTLRANVGMMWELARKALYQQANDLPSLATREALQNGWDAIRAAIKARQLREREGRFDVVWDAGKSTLSWSDNGIGMDRSTLEEKFLSLGDSGKRDSSGSEEASGGFGIAKAVILGVSKTFTWRLHTRDLLADAKGFREGYRIYRTGARQGTQITVYDVDGGTAWDGIDWSPIEKRLEVLLGCNDLPIQITFNGKEVLPLFSRRGGSVVAEGSWWGKGTTVRAKAYRRPPGDRQGAYYIRLNGLFQFRLPSQRFTLPVDVVIDLTTSLRPGEVGYPLNAARDAFQEGDVRNSFRDLVTEVERESETAGDAPEYQITDPDDDAELGTLTEAAIQDPDLRRLLSDATVAVQDYYEAEAKRPAGKNEVQSAAPGGSPERPAEDQPSRVIPGAPAGFSVAPDIEGVAVASLVIEKFLDAASEASKTELSADVKQVLSDAAQGHRLSPAQAGLLEQAIEQAAETAIGPGGGGMLQVAAAPAALKALDQMAERPPPRRRSPFERFCHLRVHKDYDRARARSFKKRFDKFLPYLIVWDATLRMIAQAAGIRRKFKPGFLLHPRINGMAAEEYHGTAKQRAVIYINPDAFTAALRANKERPAAVAYFLHSLACHELTHLDGRMGDGHGQEFVYAREDIGRATAHLLPAIQTLLVKMLKLDPPPSEADRTVRELRRLLARCEQRRKPVGLAELKAELRSAVSRLPPGPVQRRARELLGGKS